jgi:L-rhamnose isomerase
MKNKEIKKDKTVVYKEVKDDRTIVYESKLYTVDEFVSKYSNALRSYLLTRQLGDKNKKSHIVDLAVENASFAESLYIGMDSFG